MFENLSSSDSSFFAKESYTHYVTRMLMFVLITFPCNESYPALGRDVICKWVIK